MPHKIEKAEGVYTAGTLPRILGDNLRRAREEMGLTQTRFGLMVGLSRQMINTLECRGCNIQIDSLQRIADGLDIPAWKLLEDHTGECTERENSHSTHMHRHAHVCW